MNTTTKIIALLILALAGVWYATTTSGGSEDKGILLRLQNVVGTFLRLVPVKGSSPSAQVNPSPTGSLTPSPSPAVAGATSGPITGNTYTVVKGDNLWNIAQRKYGSGFRYHDIVKANADKIKDPDLIYPGQVFVLP